MPDVALENLLIVYLAAVTALLLLIALLRFGPAGLLGASSWLWTVIASLWLTFSTD